MISWHVISRSGVVISITNCYIRLTFYFKCPKLTSFSVYNFYDISVSISKKRSLDFGNDILIRAMRITKFVVL